MAIWSVGKYYWPLTVARARIWHERDAGPGEQPRLLLPHPTPTGTWEVDRSGKALTATFECDTNGWGMAPAPFPQVDDSVLSLRPRKGRPSQCLRATNASTGGDLLVWWGTVPLDLRKFSRLRFDYKLDPEAKVNLYFRLGNRYHVVLFSAPDRPGRNAKPIGRIEGVVADGRWRRASFDLQAALRHSGLLRTEAPPVTSGIAFAAPDEGYLRAGFGGNRVGTSFCLDNVRLDAAPGVTVGELEAIAASGANFSRAHE